MTYIRRLQSAKIKSLAVPRPNMGQILCHGKQLCRFEILAVDEHEESNIIQHLQQSPDVRTGFYRNAIRLMNGRASSTRHRIGNPHMLPQASF